MKAVNRASENLLGGCFVCWALKLGIHRKLGLSPLGTVHENRTRTPPEGGGLPREGVVAEKFVPSLVSLSSLGFEETNLGCFGNLAGMSRTPGGVQKVCAKKVRAHLSFPFIL